MFLPLNEDQQGRALACLLIQVYSNIIIIYDTSLHVWSTGMSVLVFGTQGWDSSSCDLPFFCLSMSVRSLFQNKRLTHTLCIATDEGFCGRNVLHSVRVHSCASIARSQASPSFFWIHEEKFKILQAIKAGDKAGDEALQCSTTFVLHLWAQQEWVFILL